MTGEYRVTWFCEFLLKCSYETTLKVSSLYYFCLFCCCVILLVHELYIWDIMASSQHPQLTLNITSKKAWGGRKCSPIPAGTCPSPCFSAPMVNGFSRHRIILETPASPSDLRGAAQINTLTSFPFSLQWVVPDFQIIPANLPICRKRQMLFNIFFSFHRDVGWCGDRDKKKQEPRREGAVPWCTPKPSCPSLHLLQGCEGPSRVVIHSQLCWSSGQTKSTKVPSNSTGRNR